MNALARIERKLKGKDDNTKSIVDDSTVSALSKIIYGPYLNSPSYCYKIRVVSQPLKVTKLIVS